MWQYKKGDMAQEAPPPQPRLRRSDAYNPLGIVLNFVVNGSDRNHDYDKVLNRMEIEIRDAGHDLRQRFFTQGELSPEQETRLQLVEKRYRALTRPQLFGRKKAGKSRKVSGRKSRKVKPGKSGKSRKVSGRKSVRKSRKVSKRSGRKSRK